MTEEQKSAFVARMKKSRKQARRSLIASLPKSEPKLLTKTEANSDSISTPPTKRRKTPTPKEDFAEIGPFIGPRF